MLSNRFRYLSQKLFYTQVPHPRRIMSKKMLTSQRVQNLIDFLEGLDLSRLSSSNAINDTTQDDEKYAQSIKV